MANADGREALRGAEEETFDLIAKVLTSRLWAEWLRAPLESAAADGKRDLALKLVGAGARIGDALHAAARNGHEEIVNDLLERGAPTSTKDVDGCTPLHIAAGQGNTDMVQALLLKGADKNTLDNEERTPLCLASSRGHVAAALALLAAGAGVNIRCGGFMKVSSVLHIAARGGLVDVMRAAIERGAYLEAADAGNYTALHHAAISNEATAVDVLVEAGADIEVPGGDESSTPLHSAAEHRSQEALLALLKHGADANARSEYLDRPLHWAAAIAGTGAAKVVDSLLRSGADETILNEQGQEAADMVGVFVFNKEKSLAQDVDRVRELLANAPVDRAWRRRGYLVLCRAHPGRLRQIQDTANALADMALTTRSAASLGTTEASGCSGYIESSPEDEDGGGDWAVVVARMMMLPEGIFRGIVEFL